MSVKSIESETNVIVTPCHAPHLEALPEDGLAAKAVALRDVATLAHELQLKCGGQVNTIKGGQLTIHDKHACCNLARELQWQGSRVAGVQQNMMGGGQGSWHADMLHPGT